VPALIAALKVEEVEFRIAVVHALGAAGPAAARAVEPLTALLKDSPVALQRAIVTTLGGLGPESAQSVPVLLALLAHKDASLRTAVLEALAEMGPAALKSVPAVTKLLKSDERAVRASAAFALGSVGREPENAANAERQAIRDALKESVPPLREAALNDKDASVRLYAAQALWIVARQPLAVGVLKKCLRDEAAGIRAAAAQALGDMGRETILESALSRKRLVANAAADAPRTKRIHLATPAGTRSVRADGRSSRR